MSYNQHNSRQILLLALGFDVVQLATLLYLTGGLINPFAIFLSGASHCFSGFVRCTIYSNITNACRVLSTFLTIYYLPLPWWPDSYFTVPDLYIFGIWTAISLSAVFIAVYVFWLAADARRTDDALSEAEQTLAQDRQSNAVGALATAAAHKLGSPLNTITLISHELLADAEADDPHFEDIQLLAQEVDRCRDSIGLDTDGSPDILLPASHVPQYARSKSQAKLISS